MSVLLQRSLRMLDCESEVRFRPGNLGPADLDIAFKPPTGLGLAIDASVVVGGGYLSFDPEKEEYSGVLQLEIAEKISVKAIGMLTTRMPDGGKGYSLVADHFRGRVCADPTGVWICVDGHRRTAGASTARSMKKCCAPD